jgi:ADP-dependent NAD(P)H-hydrate dehydratase / NAD(P)H-hydrate epimerase
VAVDVPSGVEASTGCVTGAAVHADVTVTFGTYKPGLLVDPGAAHAGVVTLVDIGLDPYLPPPVAESLQAADVAGALPSPGRDQDKYRRGVVGVVAGSEAYTGAAVLAVAGALHGGAGMVRFVAPPKAADAVRARWPEAVVTSGLPSRAGRVQAWVIGPGIGTDDEARRRLDDVLATDVPVLVDADGVSLLAGQGRLARDAGTLLTPHAGELARLLGVDRADVEASRLEHARRAADEYGATVLLKGSTTVVAAPGDAPVRVNGTGTPWLATAGSGDVLSGLAGALLAAGLTTRDAGSVGAYLHGLAARLVARDAPVTSLAVAGAVPRAWRRCAAPSR